MSDKKERIPESGNVVLSENDNNRAVDEFEDELEEGEIVDDDDDCVDGTDKVVESTVLNSGTRAQSTENHVREYSEPSWEIERGRQRILHNPWSNPQGIPEYYMWPIEDESTSQSILSTSINNNGMKRNAGYSLNDDDNLQARKKRKMGNWREEYDAADSHRYRSNISDGADDSHRCNYNRPTVYGKRETGVVVAPTSNGRTTEPCKYYHAAGRTCYSGSNCRFSHAEIGEKQKRLLLESFGKPRSFGAGPSKHRGRRQFTNNNYYYKEDNIPSLLEMKIPIPPGLKKTDNGRDTDYGIAQTKSSNARAYDKGVVDDSLIVKIRDNVVKNVEDEKRTDHGKEEVIPTAPTAVCYSSEPLLFDYDESSDEDDLNKLVIELDEDN